VSSAADSAVFHTCIEYVQGADKALAGGDQISSKKGGDSDAEAAAVPVKAVANGSLIPGPSDKDISGGRPALCALSHRNILC